MSDTNASKTDPVLDSPKVDEGTPTTVDTPKDDKNELEAAGDSEAKEAISAVLEPMKTEGADPVLDSPKVDEGTPTTVDTPKDDKNELEAAGASGAKGEAKEATSAVLEPTQTEGAPDPDPSDWDSLKPPQPPSYKPRGSSSNPTSGGRPKPRPKPPPK
ncbi:hypothetical protein K438DRAFT_922416 [Mycena galopus ATCC 62051]|nr:hypothetical protein K438DRAFT_922416 [Mycena galopus ATCC 62051]